MSDAAPDHSNSPDATPNDLAWRDDLAWRFVGYQLPPVPPFLVVIGAAFAAAAGAMGLGVLLRSGELFLFGIVAGLVVMVLTALGIRERRATIQLRQDGVRGVGRVLGRAFEEWRQVDIGSLKRGRTLYSRWAVRYRYLVAGREYSGDSPPLPEAEARSWRMGDEVDIIYDPEHPAHCWWLGRVAHDGPLPPEEIDRIIEAYPTFPGMRGTQPGHQSY